MGQLATLEALHLNSKLMFHMGLKQQKIIYLLVIKCVSGNQLLLLPLVLQSEERFLGWLRVPLTTF